MGKLGDRSEGAEEIQDVGTQGSQQILSSRF